MKRIQRTSFFDYSWKENPNAIYVGRPTKYGNPFKESDYGLVDCLVKYRVWLREKLSENPSFLDPLLGKDLVCFCRVDMPCHADIIQEFLYGG